jgi:hypothetical protein
VGSRSGGSTGLERLISGSGLTMFCGLFRVTFLYHNPSQLGPV